VFELHIITCEKTRTVQAAEKRKIHSFLSYLSSQPHLSLLFYLPALSLEYGAAPV
jgi:hypothetical protein